MSETENKAAVPYMSPSEKFKVDPQELMKALEADGVPVKADTSNTPDKPAQEAPKVTDTPPPAPPAAKAEEKAELPALARIARERDAFRKEMEANKHQLEALRAIPQHTVSAIAKAIAAGDPVSLLAAAGMTHQQYNNSLLGKMERAEKPEESPKEASGNKELDEMRRELQAIKAERDTEKMQASRTQLLGQMKDILRGSPKFETINGLEDFDGVERVLIDYHKQHGSLPGENLKESVELAAEFYEAQLKKEAERWSRVLTKGKPDNIVASKAPESPTAGTVASRTLTNANTSAPAAPRAVPKTRQEIIDALVSGQEIDLET